MKNKVIQQFDSYLIKTREYFIKNIAISYFIGSGILALFYTNIVQIPYTGEQYFVFLAYSFLHGKLYFFTNAPLADTTGYAGHYFWPEGPFPSILLIVPVFIFGLCMHQGYIQFLLNLLNLFLLYRIASKITGNKNTAIWLAGAYVFSTAYISVAFLPWAWYFAQIVTTSLSLLALDEFFHKKRWLIIGTLFAFAIATRIDIIFSGAFYILSIFFSEKKSPEKIKDMLLFSFPVLTGVLLLLEYNFLRFHSYFEQGYSQQLIKKAELLKNFKIGGLWNFRFFPSNLYYFFLKGPDAVFIRGTTMLKFPFVVPDPWGMSIFLTSPIFLWCFRTQWAQKFVRFCSVAIFLVAFSLFGYYGIGFRQFGFRYGLDFYPYLFIILSYTFSKQTLSTRVKILLLISFLFNLYESAFIYRSG